MKTPPTLTPKQRTVLVFAASSLLALGLIFWPHLGELRPTSSPQLQPFIFPSALDHPAITATGWAQVPEGMGLTPGQTASLHLSVTRDPKKQFILDLPLSQHVAAFVTVQGDGEAVRFQVDAQKADALDLTDFAAGAREIQLQIEFRDTRASGPAAVALQKLVLIQQKRLFPLDIAAFFVGSFVLILLILRTALSTEQEVLIAGVAGLIGWTVVYACVPIAMQDLSEETFFVLLAGLLRRWHTQGELGRPGLAVEQLSALAILLVALNARWEEAAKIYSRSLDPDPQTYLELAANSHFFVDTEFREPLYIFAAKVGGWVFGPTPMGMRMTTILLSLGVIALTWRAGRDLFSAPVGLLAAAFLALNRNFLYINIRGYRLELYAALALAFFWFCFGKKGWSVKRRTIGLAVAASLLCLTRANTYSALFVMLVFVYLRNGWSKGLMAVCLLTPLVALGPSMIYWSQKYGDPMIAVNKHLKYYRNIEFADHPEVPREGDPYRGPDTNGADYFLLKWHKPHRTVLNIVLGLFRIFLGDYGWRFLFLGSSLVMGLSVLGLVRWAFTDRWPFLIWLLLFSAPVAFFVEISLDFRLTMHILPVLGFAIGDFLQTFWGYFRAERDLDA